MDYRKRNDNKKPAALDEQQAKKKGGRTYVLSSFINTFDLDVNPSELEKYYKDIKKSREALLSLAKKLLQNPNLLKPINIIHVPPGLGKTHAFLQATLDTDNDIVFAAPTRELAEDIYQRGLALGFPEDRTGLVFGRDPKECLKDGKLFQHLLDAKINATEILCKDCKLECAYRKRLKEGKDKPIIITTHAMASTLTKMKRGHCLVIYDESLDIDMAICQWERTLKQAERVEKLSEIPCTEWTRRLYEAIQEYKKASIIHDQIIFGEQTNRPVHGNIINTLAFLSDAGLMKDIQKIRKAFREKRISNPKSFYSKYGILIHRGMYDVISGKLENKILLSRKQHYVSNMTPDRLFTPCIILDATPRIAQQFKRIQYIKQEQPLKYDINIIHCIHGAAFAKKAALKKDPVARKKIVDYLHKTGRTLQDKKTLVITKKALHENEWFRRQVKDIIGKDSIIRHYGEIRGLDKYKNMDACLLFLNHHYGSRNEKMIALETMRQYELLQDIQQTSPLSRRILYSYILHYLIFNLRVSEPLQALCRVRSTIDRPAPPFICLLGDKSVMHPVQALTTGQVKKPEYLLQPMCLDIINRWITLGCPKVGKIEKFVKENMTESHAALFKAIGRVKIISILNRWQISLNQNIDKEIVEDMQEFLKRNKIIGLGTYLLHDIEIIEDLETEDT